jgi:hypothetical protein
VESVSSQAIWLLAGLVVLTVAVSVAENVVIPKTPVTKLPLLGEPDTNAFP